MATRKMYRTFIIINSGRPKRLVASTETAERTSHDLRWLERSALDAKEWSRKRSGRKQHRALHGGQAVERPIDPLHHHQRNQQTSTHLLRHSDETIRAGMG
jgi:hypothetical protein